jgi:hypothetical protein
VTTTCVCCASICDKLLCPDTMLNTSRLCARTSHVLSDSVMHTMRHAVPCCAADLLCFICRTPCRRKKHIILIRKTLTPTSEQLMLLPLRPGANTITFRAGGAADLTAYVYLLRWNTRLVRGCVGGGVDSLLQHFSLLELPCMMCLGCDPSSLKRAVPCSERCAAARHPSCSAMPLSAVLRL